MAEQQEPNKAGQQGQTDHVIKELHTTPTEDGSETPLDRVRERAYRIWEEEGRPEGMALQHWLRAKQEIIGRI